MNRSEAEAELRRIFGIDHFYDEQWRAIERILRGERILMIERTGFGKSLCYQFPATQFPGVTVVFSPLIALMRNQVCALNEKGISAASVNCEQSPEDNERILEDAVAGKIKILYIAPEKQENEAWKEAVRRMKLSMVVVDEAHTISTWGHDFRPAFRRIIDLVRLLPAKLPVLTTTATATLSVQKDVEEQIAGRLSTIRGNLIRPNFNLYVVRVKSEDEKMIWMAANIGRLEGTGIIYTGTRVATEQYAGWLRFAGVSATDYNAGFDAETRKDIEKGWLENRWKCVVSTNALGMGIDKPDVRFVIHTQIPASPVHYYQEIGRAGRDGKKAEIILFYNESVDLNNGMQVDKSLPIAFIEGARPAVSKYRKVIELLEEEPLGERVIMKRANLKQTQVRVIIADLKEQGIVRETKCGKSKLYEYCYGAPELNTELFEKIRKAKRKDLNAMIDYIYTDQPRMKFLCSFLDSDEDSEYGNCDNTDLSPIRISPEPGLSAKLEEFRETYFPKLELAEKPTKKQASRLTDGYAASFYGVSNVGAAIHRSKYGNGGDFPDFLLKKSLSLFGRKYKGIELDLVLYVPPTKSGDLVRNFAEKFASVIRVPLSHGLVKTRKTEEQKVFQNSYNKKDNVAGAFDIEAGIVQGKNILLIDDIYDSGATLKEIGKMLTSRGAESIVPLVIAKTVGGTL